MDWCVKLFVSDLGVIHGTSDDPQVWNSSHSTLKTVKHGGAKIMVWGCFSYYGIGPIYLIPGIMGQFEYISTWQPVPCTVCSESSGGLSLFHIYILRPLGCLLALTGLKTLGNFCITEQNIFTICLLKFGLSSFLLQNELWGLQISGWGFLIQYVPKPFFLNSSWLNQADLANSFWNPTSVA